MKKEMAKTRIPKKVVTVTIFDKYNPDDKVFLKCAVEKHAFVSSYYAYCKYVRSHFSCNAFLKFFVPGVDSYDIPSDLIFYRANFAVVVVTRRGVA